MGCMMCFRAVSAVIDCFIFLYYSMFYIVTLSFVFHFLRVLR